MLLCRQLYVLSQEIATIDGRQRRFISGSSDVKEQGAGKSESF
jgi:hypothetical protein